MLKKYTFMCTDWAQQSFCDSMCAYHIIQASQTIDYTKVYIQLSRKFPSDSFISVYTGQNLSAIAEIFVAGGNLCSRLPGVL